MHDSRASEVNKAAGLRRTNNTTSVTVAGSTSPLAPQWSGHHVSQVLSALWQVLLELSPWLLLGAGVASVLHIAVPSDFVRRQLRGRGAVWKAVALGVPMPLCSCGVIPAGLGLKRQGASDGAAIGFLISTPQTGVDSILVSAAFLGWPFALFKVGSAALLGVLGGTLTDRVPGPQTVISELTIEEAPPRTLRGGVDHGLSLLRMVWRWVAFGVVVSALLTTFVPADAFAGLAAHGAIFAMGAVLLVSVPLYVCATASVPIAAALVASGFPPGAALVFLMAGPATNVATIGAVYRAFGGPRLAVYLVTILVGSITLGYAFDFLLAPSAHVAVVPEHAGGPVAVLATIVWLAMMSFFALDDLRRFARSRVNAKGAVTIGVEGMTCGGCARKLEGKLVAAEGVTSARVSLEPGRASVVGLDEAALCALVEAAGYRAIALDEMDAATMPS